MRTPAKQIRAFSLVEVVLALGVCVFCLLILQGMFLIGVNAGHESTADIQASNIASFLITQRSVNPINTLTSVSPASPLPVLNASANGSVYLNAYGQTTTTAATATYLMSYTILTNTYHIAQLQLTLTSPPTATLANAKTRYDVLTYVNLP